MCTVHDINIVDNKSLNPTNYTKYGYSEFNIGDTSHMSTIMYITGSFLKYYAYATYILCMYIYIYICLK